MSEALADNVIVVFFAYVAAFLPWTAFAATDFISPIWRTLSETRREGCYNLAFSVVPAAYIIFYIVIQARAGDYKETFAAIVALVFALQHTLRTAWGLWQLKSFRDWACYSIASLQAVGIVYKSRRITRDDDRKLTEIADDLLVNETLIENRLFHGESRCYLRYGSRVFKLRGTIGKRGFLQSRVELIIEVIRFLPEWLVDRVRELKGRRDRPSLQQVPHHPVEVWLNWATAFAAQGLNEWLEEFHVIEDPDRLPSSSKLTNVELFEQRRAHFAGQVLASAALHLWPESIGVSGVPSPFLWSTWRSGTDMCGGRLSKMDLLRHAMECHDIFPFKYPHLGAEMVQSPEPDHFARRGYRAYARKLERVVESVPADFGEAIETFDDLMLEWLTILLYLGAMSVQVTNSSRDIFADSYLQDRFRPVEPRRKCVSDPEDRDIAVINLRDQLGMRSEHHAIASGWTSFPLPLCALQQLADHHPLILKAGELIDVWLAFVAGDQMSFGSDLHEVPSAKSMSSTDEVQTYLETSRLKRQFAHPHQPFWHLEQTIAFMGHQMEFLRSRLATWDFYRQAGVEDMSVWTPHILFKTSAAAAPGPKLATTEWITLGKVPDAIADELRKGNGYLYLQRRAVQVRLTWEVQSALKTLCTRTEHVTSPASIGGILLCLLSFPALFCVVCSSGSKSLTICTATPSTNASTWMVRISPHSGPQDYFMMLELLKLDNDNFVMRGCLGKEAGQDEDTFQWEKWRDAFMSRIEAFANWQSSFKYLHAPVHRRKRSMTSGCMTANLNYKGRREDFRFWKAWEPFRMTDCLFELGSKGFSIQKSVSNDLTTVLRKRIAEGYSADTSPEKKGIPRPDIYQACMLIAEIVKDDGIMKLDVSRTATQEVIADKVVRMASFLLARSPEDSERALVLLETAAGGLGSSEAIVASVQILTNGQFQKKNVARAARLISDHLNLFNREQSSNQSEEMERLLLSFVPIFIELLDETGYSDDAVVMFSNFLSWLVWTGSPSSHEHANHWLRKAFVKSRCFHVIHALGIVKEVEALQSTTSLKTVDYCRKAYLERAILGGDRDAMLSLAYLLRYGTANIPKDLPRAKALYKEAVKTRDQREANSNLDETVEHGIADVTYDLSQATELAMEGENRNFVDPGVPERVYFE